MSQIFASYGPVFLVREPRSSNLSQDTLRVYPYKHHIVRDNIVFDLDANGEAVEDRSNPIAKIDWHDGSVKILNKDLWKCLSQSIQEAIELDFANFYQWNS